MKFKYSKKTLQKICDKDTAQVHFCPNETKDKIWFDRESGQLSIAIGIGKDLSLRKMRLLYRRIVHIARENNISLLALDLNKTLALYSEINAEKSAEMMAYNMELADYQFVQYKSANNHHRIKEVILTGKSGVKIKNAITTGQIKAQEVNTCRTLVNTPSCDLTPVDLANKVRELVGDLPIDVEILDKKKMEKLNMGGILTVARGSERDPRFIILKYRYTKNSNPLVLVGKAVTFDGGGINLKPGPFMLGMHMDMAGGASVIQSIVLAAKLGIQTPVVGLIGAAENIISPTGYRPADIIRTMSGLTVEVLNTDAEGRIILADALTYAQRFKPRLVVDIATLTGAAIVALGQRACALFTRHDEYRSLCCQLAEETGNYMWPLPLWEEYEEEIKGTFGDITNIQCHTRARSGGAVIGAIFLSHFAKDFPWIHLDIAPRIETIPGDYLARGATGEPVTFLAKLIEHFAKK